MGCGCNKGRAGARAVLKYKLTLPAGLTFEDGTNRKTFDTLDQARDARTEQGNVGTIKPVQP